VTGSNDFSDAGDFIRDVFTTMVEACRMRDLWVPAVTFSVAMDIAAAAANWPFRDGLNPPPPHTITVMALLILAKGWFSLTLCRIALAGLRGQVTGVLNQWVSVQDALRIGLVTTVLMFPILLGFAFLIVPGLYLLGRWSQVPLALIDGQATWFDAVDISRGLTAPFWPAILILLMSTATATLLVEYLIHDITPLAWIYRAAGSTVGAALAAATYHELTRRAPWE
jgi:hypothetical protein